MVSGKHCTMVDLQWESPLVSGKTVGGAREATENLIDLGYRLAAVT